MKFVLAHQEKKELMASIQKDTEVVALFKGLTRRDVHNLTDQDLLRLGYERYQVEVMNEMPYPEKFRIILDNCRYFQQELPERIKFKVRLLGVDAFL